MACHPRHCRRATFSFRLLGPSRSCDRVGGSRAGAPASHTPPRSPTRAGFRRTAISPAMHRHHMHRRRNKRTTLSVRLLVPPRPCARVGGLHAGAPASHAPPRSPTRSDSDRQRSMAIKKCIDLRPLNGEPLSGEPLPVDPTFEGSHPPSTHARRTDAHRSYLCWGS